MIRDRSNSNPEMKKITFLKDDDYHLIIKLQGKAYQKGQESMLCDFYAENYIRIRYGKQSAKPGRALEKMHSTTRKGITEAYDVCSELIALLSKYQADPAKALLIAKQHLSQALEKKNANLPKYYGAILKEISFLESSKLLEEGKDKFQSHQKFIHILKERREKKIQHILRSALNSTEIGFSKIFEKEKNLQDGSSLSFFWRKKRREDFGLKLGPWCVADGFDKLLLSLKTHGAHLATGWFGEYCYTTKKIPVTSPINGESFYGFIKGSKRHIAEMEKNNKACHCIIIVGSNKKQQLIYYIDPIYSSTYGKPEHYFVISYKTFTEGLIAVDGFKEHEKLPISQPCLLIGPQLEQRQLEEQLLSSPLIRKTL